jgi:hypothetical protein
VRNEMRAEERCCKQRSSEGDQGPGPNERHIRVTKKFSKRVRNLVELL